MWHNKEWLKVLVALVSKREDLPSSTLSIYNDWAELKGPWGRLRVWRTSQGVHLAEGRKREDWSWAEVAEWDESETVHRLGWFIAQIAE